MTGLMTHMIREFRTTCAGIVLYNILKLFPLIFHLHKLHAGHLEIFNWIKGRYISSGIGLHQLQ